MKSPKGRLELTWMGKDAALIPAEHGQYDYQWVDRADPRAREVKSIQVIDTVGELDGPSGAGENLLIAGESADALRSLGTVPEWSQKYRGQVKLVYIDPPFNTDQAFEHYADALEHSVWLTMMRDRIRDLKPLMADDASIWVHLDDSEVHRMRVLLDEEFGAENFMATVIWQKAYSPRNDAPTFSTDQDYILVYAKNPEWRGNRLERLASRDALYKSTDGDPRPWVSGDPAAPGAHTHEGMVYGIQSPFTGELIYPARGRHWGQNQDGMQAMIEEWGVPYKRVDIGDNRQRAHLCGVSADEVRPGVQALLIDTDIAQAERTARGRYEAGSWPRLYFTKGGNGGLKLKRYLDEISTSRATQTLWFHDDVGHNRSAKHEMNLLFPEVTAFATPKPERLLERIMHIATHPGDLVLDCFAGSGTTAAVAHKMGRRWVTVELQQATVDRFLLPRLTKVVRGEDPGGITTKKERVGVAELPEGVTPEDAQLFTTLLGRVSKAVSGLDPHMVKALRTATRTKEETTVQWAGGGGFALAHMGPSMYEVDDEDGEVYLSEDATNGAFSKAVAGQLRFSLTPDHPVFCGAKRRLRLAVVDGVADEQVVRTVVEHLSDGERAVVVAKGVLPEAEQLLSELSPGSRLRKAPEDLFPKATVK